MVNKTISEIKGLLANKKKVSLGFYPTPFYKLKNMSKKLGVNLYIKRDDFSGQSLFGGNKIRKLEYLLGDAIDKGAEYVFTYGATQSNHAMQTAEACNKLNLKPILYLRAVVEPDENDIKGNLLLDKILGAEVHVVRFLTGETQDEAKKRIQNMGKEHIKRLEAAGYKCYNIPGGGANSVGTIGFIGEFIELLEQLQKLNLHMDYLFHANGSGGTMAGLCAGKKLTGSDVKIVSVDVNKHDLEYLNKKVGLANQCLRYIGIDGDMTINDFFMEPNYYLPGYEQPNTGGTEAIKMLAHTEALFVDPVYTGKALAGLIDYVRQGKIEKGSNVVFWHTGGATALFAEKQILGRLY